MQRDDFSDGGRNHDEAQRSTSHWSAYVNRLFNRNDCDITASHSDFQALHNPTFPSSHSWAFHDTTQKHTFYTHVHTLPAEEPLPQSKQLSSRSLSRFYSHTFTVMSGSVSPGQRLMFPLSGFPWVHGCHDDWPPYESSPRIDVLLAVLS